MVKKKSYIYNMVEAVDRLWARSNNLELVSKTMWIPDKILGLDLILLRAHPLPTSTRSLTYPL